MIRKIRKRFFLAVEGQGERSFVTWLQKLADSNGLYIHLDCEPLNGGGYKAMFEEALRARKRKNRAKAQACILIVDGDRSQNNDDSWSVVMLKQKANKEKIQVVVQNPNQEGLLLRMLTPNKKQLSSTSEIKNELQKAWPTYRKPVDTRALLSKFSIEDLRQIAHSDPELRTLLSIIGLH